MIRILVFSDLHLDMSFAGASLPSLVARRFREDLRRSLERILQFAREQRVDAVAIAGDLYEQERFSPDTGTFLAEQFGQIAPIRVFIAPGNHDPWAVDSLYRFVEWPSNVTIFSEWKFSRVHLGEGVYLWGNAHRSLSERKNPLTELRLPAEGKHILLFHGSDTTHVPDGRVAHAPFTPAEAEATGAVAALVGHYHQPRIEREGRCFIIYPGSPEPLGFGESGEHGVALLEIEGDSVHVERIPLARYRFVQGELDVSGAATRDAIRDRIVNWAKEHGGENTFLRLTLVKELHPDVDIDRELLADLLNKHATHGTLIDRTVPGFLLEEIQTEQTLRGEYVRHMLRIMEQVPETERPIYQQALLLGLRALEGRPLLPDHFGK